MKANVLESFSLADYLHLRRAQAATTAASGLPAREPIPTLLRTDESVAVALRRLSSKRIQSAPLVRVHPDGIHYDTVGFLSVGDLARFFVENSVAVAPPSDPVLVRLAALTAQAVQFSLTPLSNVPSSMDGTAVWQPGSMTLADAARKCFFYGSPPVQGWPINHRFAVHDASARVSDIVSQSDLAAFVLTNIASLGELGNRSLASLGLGSKAPIVLPAAMPVVDCFAVIARERVSAAAVIDDATGAILANLSDADMRYLSPESFGAFALPVGEYLIHAYGVKPTMPPPGTFSYNPQSTPFGVALSQSSSVLTVTAKSDSSLAGTLQQLVGNGVHRVWVIDEARRPTGVVSLTDILALLVGVTPLPDEQVQAPVE